MLGFWTHRKGGFSSFVFKILQDELVIIKKWDKSTFTNAFWCKDGTLISTTDIERDDSGFRKVFPSDLNSKKVELVCGMPGTQQYVPSISGRLILLNLKFAEHGLRLDSIPQLISMDVDAGTHSVLWDNGNGASASNCDISKNPNTAWFCMESHLKSINLDTKSTKSRPLRHRCVAIRSNPSGSLLAMWTGAEWLVDTHTTLLIWDTVKDRLVHKFGFNSASTPVEGCWSPDGKYFAISASSGWLLPSYNDRILIFSPEERKVKAILTVPESTEDYRAIAWYSNPDRVVSVTRVGVVWQWRGVLGQLAGGQ